MLHGYLDGELELAATLEMERHLQSCQSCARAYDNQRILRSAIRSSAQYYKAPARLRRRVRPAAWIAPMGIAAAIAVMLAGTWFALRPPPGRELIAQEVVSGHIRSLMANHLTDVPSSDRHTVKPWFLGKLDFSPEVKDLAGQGFPLIGGRLDYLNERPAAALVYRRGGHVINLFVSAAAGPGHTAARGEVVQGFNTQRWSDQGLRFIAISDINADELREFHTRFEAVLRGGV